MAGQGLPMVLQSHPAGTASAAQSQKLREGFALGRDLLTLVSPKRLEKAEDPAQPLGTQLALSEASWALKERREMRVP